MYYSVIGTLVTIIVGTLVSWATSSTSDEYDEKLLHPAILKIRRYLSKNKNGVANESRNGNAQINYGFDNGPNTPKTNGKTTVAVTQTSLSSADVFAVTAENCDGIFKFEEIELTIPKGRDRCTNELKLQIEPIEKYRKLSIT